MLAFSPTAHGALEAYARPAFAARVRTALAAKYPHFLPRFPEKLQDLITGNMLGRAAMWGLSHQSSLLGFCEIMITVAANFDEEPEIRSHLEAAPQPKDFAFRALPKTVPKPAWTRAERRRSNLPFFIPPSFAAQPLPEQTVAALPVVLFDRPDAQNARAAVSAAAGQPDELDIRHLPDAVLVVAACRSFWGPGFTAMSWMAELTARRVAPTVMLAAMRARLAIAFGRFV